MKRNFLIAPVLLALLPILVGAETGSPTLLNKTEGSRYAAPGISGGAGKTRSTLIAKTPPEPEQETDPRVLLEQGRAYYDEEAYSQALEVFNQALQFDPDPELRITLLNARSAASYKNGDPPQSEDLAALQEIQADDPALLLLRANAFRNRGAHNRAIADYLEILRLDPQNGEAFYNRGIAHYYQGEIDQAITELTEAIKINPMPEAYIYRGLLYDMKGKIPQADKDYQDALEAAGEDPENPAALMGQGRLAAHRGQYEEAVAAYTKALGVYDKAREIDPGYAAAFNYRAQAYLYMKAYTEALADYTQALRLNPAYTLVLSDRGFVYYNQGEYDLAVKDYDEVLRFNPGSARAFNNRAFVYFIQGDYSQAIADYTEALRIDPRLGASLYGRGNAYMKLEAFDNAVGDYAAAVPSELAVQSLQGLGLAHFRLQNYDQALESYTKALALDPKSAVTLNNRGQAYFEKGEYEQAIKDYEEAVALNPAYLEARKNLQKASDAYDAEGFSEDDAGGFSGNEFQDDPDEPEDDAEEF